MKGFFTQRGKSQKPSDRHVGTTRHKFDDAKETASAVESEVASPHVTRGVLTAVTFNFRVLETLETILGREIAKKKDAKLNNATQKYVQFQYIWFFMEKSRSSMDLFNKAV